MTDTRALGKKIGEGVAAEAEAAEAENPDEETTEPVEPEPDADEQAEEEETPEEPESKGRKQRSPQEVFQAAFSRFVAKAAECFEVLPADIVVAPHPGVVGIMLPGFSEPRTHENYTTCLTCNGLSKVLTGANTGDPTKDWHVCPDVRCKGQGYWTKNTATQPLPQTGPLAVQPVEQPNGEYAEAPTWLGDPSLGPATP